MKPGDLIEWVYVANDQIVRPREELWSTPMQKWVPIGGVHLLISRTDGVLTWLPLGANCEGLLRAHEDDAAPAHSSEARRTVTPRARG